MRFASQERKRPVGLEEIGDSESRRKGIGDSQERSKFALSDHPGGNLTLPVGWEFGEFQWMSGGSQLISSLA